MTQAVLDHEADVAIVSQRPARLKWTPLRDDPMVAWVPEGSPYIEQGYVPVDAFAEEPFIDPYPEEDTDTHHLLRSIGLTPNTKYEVNDTYAAYCLVEAGLGITLTNGITMGDWSGRVIALPIRPENIISIGMITPENYDMSPALRMFMRFIHLSSQM